MNKKVKIYFIIVLSFLFISLISDYIFLRHGILFCTNSDVQFHLKRIGEIVMLIEHGHIFSLFSFNYFHGSAVMSMYSYYMLIPLALLYISTSSYIKAYYLFFIILTFLSLIVCFFSSLKFSKSLYISYLFSIIYSLSLEPLEEMFTRTDISVMISLVFLPMIIFGFINFLYHNKYLELTIGLVLMTFCELATSIVTCLLLFIWLIFNIKCANKQLLKNLFKAILLFLLISSMVWIPLFKISFQNKIKTPGFISVPLITTNIKNIVVSVGIIAIILIPAYLLSLNKFNKMMKQMLILSIIFIILSSKLLPTKLITLCKLLNSVNKLQFSSRFLIIPHILLSYLAAYVIFKVIKIISKKNKINILLIVSILLIILGQFLGQLYLVRKNSSLDYKRVNNYNLIRMIQTNYKINNNDVKYLLNGYTRNTDYYPLSSTYKRKYINNNEAVYHNNRIINLKHKGYDTFSFNNDKDIHNLVLPFLYYNGENLNIYANHHLINYYYNKNSLITLKRVKKGVNIINIKYVPSIWLTIFKFMLFMIGITWVIWLWIKSCINKRKLKSGY